jgi:Cysteine-rich CPXCG
MPLESDAAYTCPRCFEPNFVAVDPTAGRRQRFIEDCPVCCHPIQFTAIFDPEGDPIIESAELAE